MSPSKGIWVGDWKLAGPAFCVVREEGRVAGGVLAKGARHLFSHYFSWDDDYTEEATLSHLLIPEEFLE